MTQSQGLGLATSSSRGPAEEPRLSTTAVTAMVFAAGLTAVVGVIIWSDYWPIPDHIVTVDSPWPYLLFALLGFIAEIVFVPMRHGDEREELTFFEVLVMCGVLVFLPVVALVVPLIGFMFAEPLLRRSLTKTLFNVGSYALAASALVAIYGVISGDSARFSLSSVVGLLLGALAFAMINLLTLAWVLSVAEAVPVRQLVREQWSLSVGMAIASVGIATTGVSLAANTPLLVPFALLPAAALWYAYRSSEHHGDAIERNRWLVELNTTLSTPAPAQTLIPDAADAMRRVFAAKYVMVVAGPVTYISPPAGGMPAARPSTSAERALALGADASVSELGADDLPAGWHLGYRTRVQLDGDPAVLCLGVSRQTILMQRLLPWAPGQWQLADVDRPVLATLAASMGSAVRASETLAALRDETAKMTAVVDHATDGIVVFDGEGAVSVWSPAMASITGLSSAQAAALADGDGDTTSPVAALRAFSRTARRKAAATTTDISITRPDGEHRDLQVSVVAIDEDAQTAAGALTVLTIRDMTQERRVERMKSDFIATVSHELRTPITPIKGYAQLLRNRWDRMPEQKRSDVLGTIVDRADHLSRLVDDLLMASRVSDVQTSKLEVDLTDMPLADLIAETESAFPELAGRITFTGTSAMVRCDRVRAIQCLTNLIGNANKYSPPDSPIRVESRAVPGEEFATVDVIDRGRGIPAAEQDRVFERFYRVEDPMTMTTGGSGLGLFISRELARAMGGDILLWSTVGEGSRFQLRLLQSGEETPS